jgi:hypothetical protein
MILATGRRRPHHQEVTMSRSIRTASLAAALASMLAIAPAARADSSYGDTTGAGRMYASTVKAQAAPDTTGVGIIHASMVQAQIAQRAALVRTGSGFQWDDAGLGAAAGFGAALAAVGAAAGIRSRRRVTA